MLLILKADARALPLRDETVNCVVTSPPYWGLRDYGLPGQLGLERTPGEYVENLRAVSREIWRVLRKDGTWWLVIGDSYASGKGTCFNPGGGVNSLGKDRKTAGVDPLDRGTVSTLKMSGLKPKDLVGIPWRVALSSQADGWWLRSDIVWAKPNPMPESVRDRPTRAHEYVFLLTKAQRYYYDRAAVLEPSQSGPSDIRKMVEKRDRIGGKHKTLVDPFSKASSATRIGRKRAVGSPNGRNRRTVWTIPTQPYSGAHFATFPEKLARLCVRAGCPRGGVVLDPFAGSGTTGVAALKEGRKAILSDLGYTDLQVRRTRNVQLGLGA